MFELIILNNKSLSQILIFSILGFLSHSTLSPQDINCLKNIFFQRSILDLRNKSLILKYKIK